MRAISGWPTSNATSCAARSPSRKRAIPRPRAFRAAFERLPLLNRSSHAALSVEHDRDLPHRQLARREQPLLIADGDRHGFALGEAALLVERAMRETVEKAALARELHHGLGRERAVRDQREIRREAHRRPRRGSNTPATLPAPSG